MNASNEDRPMDDSHERLERDTAEALERWSQAQRDDVAAAREGVTDGDRAAARRAFEHLAGRRRRRATRALLLAAGILLGLGAGWFVFSDDVGDAAPGPILLGSDELTELIPDGPVDRYDRFAWTLSSETPELFGLRVWNEGEVDAVIRVDGLDVQEYVPTPAELRALGPRIRWQVTLQSREGRTLGVGSASASLRSP